METTKHQGLVVSREKKHLFLPPYLKGKIQECIRDPLPADEQNALLLKVEQSENPLLLPEFEELLFPLGFESGSIHQDLLEPFVRNPDTKNKWGKALTLFLAGKAQQACDILTQALKTTDGLPSLLTYSRALIFYHFGFYENAHTDFAKSTAAAVPRGYRGCDLIYSFIRGSQLSDVLSPKGRDPSLKTMGLDMLLQDQPDDHSVRAELARLYVYAGRPFDALTQLGELEQYAIHHGWIQLFRFYALAQLGRPAAESAIVQACEQTNYPICWMEKARWMLVHKRKPEAVEAANKVLDLLSIKKKLRKDEILFVSESQAICTGGDRKAVLRNWAIQYLPPEEALLAEGKYPRTKFYEDASRIHSDGHLSRELELFQNPPADKLSPEFWQKHVKTHEDFDPRELQIERDIKRNRHTGTACLLHPNVYADAQYFFCLKYNGELIAVLGFDIDHSGALVVRQIQGQEGQGEKLKHVRWTTALLANLEQWAKTSGISTVKIVSAQNNPWVKNTFRLLKEKGAYPGDMTIEQACEISDESQKKIAEENGRLLRQEWKEKEAKADEEKIEYVALLLPHRAFMIYDVTAKKLKYKLKAVKDHYRGFEDTFWEKSL